MARELGFQLSHGYGDRSVMDILAKTDSKATPAMHREAIKMAIENCSQSERSHKEEADRCRMARATLREFRERKPVSLRVLDGGTAEAIRLRWPAVEG